MSAATLIYPHQLFKIHPAVHPHLPIYLIEEPLLLSYNPIHRAKLVLHKLSMDAYQQRLECAGYRVHRITHAEAGSSRKVFGLLKRAGIRTIHVADTVDDYLEKALRASGLQRVWYDSPCFLLPRDEALQRFQTSQKFMANFYKALRKDRRILMQEGKPLGGKWSFDAENRKKVPKSEALPTDIELARSPEVELAAAWAESLKAESYGEAVSWLPYTHEAAEAYVDQFLHERLQNFGPYEDAITTRGARLWHSALSPLLNIGLLTPDELIQRVLAHAAEHHVALNSLEGFVRQIIGWREFIRASYECDGASMRRQNALGHTRRLNRAFWTADTDIPPVDHAIATALNYGYTHHIERLMVLGNMMLLSETHPDEVYLWFMGMYLDAYDWVMVPNVYGMSQFADGGSFATKPYIAGANYIKKMSDHQGGEWEKIFTGLYWRFIHKHSALFRQNHRLSMMPKLLGKMSDELRQSHFQYAERFLQRL